MWYMLIIFIHKPVITFERCSDIMTDLFKNGYVNLCCFLAVEYTNNRILVTEFCQFEHCFHGSVR